MLWNNKLHQRSVNWKHVSRKNWFCILDSRQQISPEEFKKLQQIRDKAIEELNKRKRLCMNLIDGIMEGYPKSKQKLIEDMEIETDEAAGFDINQHKWTILNSFSLLFYVDVSWRSGRK